MPTYLIPSEILENSPSHSAGVPAQHEKVNRIFACELIAQAGVMLKLSQACITTAQILLHRFYYRKSMVDYKVLPVAMTAIFLATKVEESHRSIRDILNVFDRVLKRRYRADPTQPLDRTSKRYNRWSHDLRKVELVMLKELGYSVYVDHPHRFILFYVRTMMAGELTDVSKQLAQKAWNYLNDAMRTDVCLRYRPEVIATAAIYLTVRVMQIPLPMNPPWYQLFGAKKLELEEVSSIVAELYTMDKAEYIPVSEKDKATNIICKWRAEAKRNSEKIKSQLNMARKQMGNDDPKHKSKRDRKRSDRSRSSSREGSSSSSSYNRRRRKKRRRGRSSSSSASRSRSRDRRGRRGDRDRNRRPNSSRKTKDKRGRLDRERDRDRDADRDRGRGRDRDRNKDSERNRDSERARESDRGRDSDRNRESDRKRRENDRERGRDRDRDRDRDRNQKDRDRGKDRNRDRDRDRNRDRQRDSDRRRGNMDRNKP
mmetsp:Transcript_9883/g.24337  ORF Transcript_9883/g.24337 Transcript_9883/m.24337 type:complete len:485 (-) Transcript_9883:245-1699(-)